MIAEATRNRNAFSAVGSISGAAMLPSENEPATSTENSNIAAWPRMAWEVENVKEGSDQRDLFTLGLSGQHADTKVRHSNDQGFQLSAKWRQCVFRFRRDARINRFGDDVIVL